MAKRTTIYLDPKLHHAMKMKAVQMNVSLSDLVDEALRLTLKEDIADLQAIRSRLHEPAVPYETVLKNLKRDGLL